MRFNWRRITTTLGLISCLMMIVPACMVAARGRVRTRPVYVVDEAPPPPRYKTPEHREGYLWVRGHWQFYSGRGWVWQDGRWERQRSNHSWEAGHWERRGNRHHWVDGRWVQAGGRVIVSGSEGERQSTPRTPRPRPGNTQSTPRRPPHAGVPASSGSSSQHPTNPPPPARAESPGAARPGYVFISGRWHWKRSKGQYEWVNGHWERARAAKVWQPGRWELRGNAYVWIDGKWVREGTRRSPKVQDNRRPR